MILENVNRTRLHLPGNWPIFTTAIFKVLLFKEIMNNNNKISQFTQVELWRESTQEDVNSCHGFDGNGSHLIYITELAYL